MKNLSLPTKIIFRVVQRRGRAPRREISLLDAEHMSSAAPPDVAVHRRCFIADHPAKPPFHPTIIM